MKKLSKHKFETATKFIKENADPINLAWYAYNFEGMSDEAFISQLGKYQFDNGGFGGLTYEYEYQGPSLKCTEHAFRYIYYLKNKPPATHTMIQKMMQYVLERYRPDIGCWGDLLEPGVNDGLHVWWWEYEGHPTPIANFDERVRQYNPNGQAALAAFVALYCELVPVELYKDVISYPVEKVLRYFDINSPLYGKSSTDPSDTEDYTVPYNVKCLSQFCDCLKDRLLVEKLKLILKQNTTSCMDLDESKWHEGYHEIPCDIVTFPESFLYEGVKDLVNSSINYVISQQTENGSWRITYLFGEDEGFRTLEYKYNVHFTMLRLAMLRRFGRIER